MIDSDVKIQVLLHILDTFMIRTCHILLEFQRLLFSKIPLNDIWKWIWNLILSSHNPANEACSTNLNLVDGLEVDFLKAFVYEGPDIELQVHPHALHDHAAWNPCMQRKSVNVILTIRIELSAVEDKPPSFPVRIGKSNFKVKSLLVQDLALQYDVWLNESQFSPIFFRCFPFGALVCDVRVAFHRFVIGLLERALS